MDQNFLIESEQALLAACLKDKSILNRISDKIGMADFFAPSHQKIYQAALVLLSDNQPIDLLSLAELITKKNQSFETGYLVDIIENTYADLNSADFHANRIKSESRRRELISRFSGWLNDIKTADPNDLAAEIVTELGAWSSTQEEISMRPINDHMRSAVEDINRRFELKGQLDGLSTGLQRLDERWEGMKPGHLIVLAARPSMGKSLIASHIATSAAKEQQVLFFSLEMTGADLMKREMAAKGNVKLDLINRPDKADDRFWSGINMAAHKLKSLNMKIDDTGGIHINRIVARARAQHQLHAVGLIVIDHIHIVQTDAKQSRERELAEISWKLKALAKELNCTVLAVAQLNRNVEQRPENSRKPVMSDLRDSGSIEQDADVVAMVYRDDYYNKDSEFKGTVEVLTKKNRGGSVGDDRFAIDLSRSKVSDLAPDYAEPEPINKNEKRYGF